MKLLRTFLATFVSIANFGPEVGYTHSHAIQGDDLHDHDDHPHPHPHPHDHHDGVDEHDDDDDHDAPGLTAGHAHVHGSWLWFSTTSPAPEDAADPVEAGAVRAAFAAPEGLEKRADAPLEIDAPWPEVRTVLPSLRPPGPHLFIPRRSTRGASSPLCDVARHARTGVLLT